jgi:hypothetical protein
MSRESASISTQSLNKIAEKINLEPIYKRYNKIIEKTEKENKEKFDQNQFMKEIMELQNKYKPNIKKSQKVVQGKSIDPSYSKAITEEILEVKKLKKLHEELEECTFHPQINKKSLDLIDSTKKKREAWKRGEEKEDIFPMKPKVIVGKMDNKASMFFDWHLKGGTQRGENRDLDRWGYDRYIFFELERCAKWI